VDARDKRGHDDGEADSIWAKIAVIVTVDETIPQAFLIPWKLRE